MSIYIAAFALLQPFGTARVQSGCVIGRRTGKRSLLCAVI